MSRLLRHKDELLNPTQWHFFRSAIPYVFLYPAKHDLWYSQKLHLYPCLGPTAFFFYDFVRKIWHERLERADVWLERATSQLEPAEGPLEKARAVKTTARLGSCSARSSFFELARARWEHYFIVTVLLLLLVLLHSKLLISSIASYENRLTCFGMKQAFKIIGNFRNWELKPSIHMLFLREFLATLVCNSKCHIQSIWNNFCIKNISQSSNLNKARYTISSNSFLL